MGFAEGFQGGYGLMDATLRNQREETLKKDELATRTAQNADANARDDRRLGLAEVTQSDARTNAAATAKYQSDMLAGNLAEKQATLGYRTQESKERADHNAASLGLQKTTAEAHLEQLKQQGLNQAQTLKNNNSDLEIKKDAAESAAKAQTKLEAGQYAQANWMNSDGTLDGKAIAADPVNATKYLGDLGVDMNHLGKNPELYHNAVQTLQDTFQKYDGKAPMDEATNPEAMGAFNTIFKGQLGTNIGKDVAGKGKIISTKATDILSHQGTPTQDNPSGMLYSIGLVNIYRGKDGKEHQDQTAAPLTQLRSNDNPDDPARGFTASQLHEALQGNAALIDGLISDPNVMGRWGNVVKRNLPKAEKADTNVQNDYLSIKNKTTNANGDVVESASSYDPKTGNQISMNPDTNRIEVSKPGDVPKQNTQKTNLQLRAEKVLKNPSNYSEQQVKDSKEILGK